MDSVAIGTPRLFTFSVGNTRGVQSDSVEEIGRPPYTICRNFTMLEIACALSLKFAEETLPKENYFRVILL